MQCNLLQTLIFDIPYMERRSMLHLSVLCISSFGRDVALLRLSVQSSIGWLLQCTGSGGIPGTTTDGICI